MSKTIVLTGATGFLGSRLCKALVQRRHHVHAYLRPTSNLARVREVADKVQWHCLPEDLDAPFRAGKTPDIVVHCAALYGRKGESAAELIECNTLLPVRLHCLAAAHGVPLFLHTGTVLEPGLNAYALSKHQAVEWLKMASHGPRVFNLKAQHFYGPGDDPTKFITSLIEQCLANVPEIRLTDGWQRRDFVYVDDVVSAMVLLLEKDIPHSGAQGRFVEFEIGSGEAVEVRQVVERIHQLTGSRSRLLFGALPYRAGEPMLTQADTSALRALGWRPAASLEEGLTQTIKAASRKA